MLSAHQIRLRAANQQRSHSTTWSPRLPAHEGPATKPSLCVFSLAHKWTGWGCACSSSRVLCPWNHLNLPSLLSLLNPRGHPLQVRWSCPCPGELRSLPENLFAAEKGRSHPGLAFCVQENALVSPVPSLHRSLADEAPITCLKTFCPCISFGVCLEKCVCQQHLMFRSRSNDLSRLWQAPPLLPPLAV